MARHSKIEWCTATWNPWQGCHKVSPACAHCYAERRDKRLKKDFETVRRSSVATFNSPLKWKTQRELIFTCSLSDFFIEEADYWRDDAWEIIHDTPQHLYLILTKRLDRDFHQLIPWMSDPRQDPWPNVCLMATAENQHWADYRTNRLLKLPARWHGLSVEPLLGPVDLLEPGGYLWPDCYATPEQHEADHAGGMFCDERLLDWVIVGGESVGPKERSLVEYKERDDCGYYCDEKVGHVDHPVEWFPKTRALQWVRSLRDQCQDAGVPFLLKQWGGPKPESGGRLLDGREWLQFPLEFEEIINLHKEASSG